MAADHSTLYGNLRSAFLARHFAINRRFRANHFYHTNELQTALGPGAILAEDADVQLAERWRAHFEGDNPFLLGSQLLTCLAVEHTLGSPDARKIIKLAPDSI